MPKIGSRLKMFRTAQGLSMREAASRIGVPETTYREWEYGRQIRGSEAYRKIAKAFNISIAALFGEGDDANDIPFDQRLNRIKIDVEILQCEIKNCKK